MSKLILANGVTGELEGAAEIISSDENNSILLQDSNLIEISDDEGCVVAPSNITIKRMSIKSNESVYYMVQCPSCNQYYVLSENNLMCPKCNIPLDKCFLHYIERRIIRPFNLNNEGERHMLSRLWAKDESGCLYPVSGISKDQILINGSWKTPEYVFTHYKDMIDRPFGYNVKEYFRETSIDRIQE